jgi:FkbM family methyltransferase
MEIKLENVAIKQCRHGVMVWPKTDRVIGASLAKYGEFAEGENRLMARYLKTGDVAVDVGANVGTTTLPMAQTVGPEGRIFAFEPQPLVAHCLATAVLLNGFSNTRLMTMAVTRDSGVAKMDFHSGGDAGNFGATSLSATGEFGATITLDHLAFSRLDLLKIDVEGHEWDVFQGAVETIKSCRPVVYFEAKPVTGTVASIDFLQKLGYRCFWHFAHFFRSDNFLGNMKDIFPGVGDMNVLAVPQGKRLPEDLPEIQQADEDWRLVYSTFFTSRGLNMP